MSGNGKIMCNHGVNLFRCQTCIDALVSEQISKQDQRITELEQQLKTANEQLEAYNLMPSLIARQQDVD